MVARIRQREERQVIGDAAARGSSPNLLFVRCKAAPVSDERARLREAWSEISPDQQPYREFASQYLLDHSARRLRVRQHLVQAAQNVGCILDFELALMMAQTDQLFSLRCQTALKLRCQPVERPISSSDSQTYFLFGFPYFQAVAHLLTTSGPLGLRGGQ